MNSSYLCLASLHGYNAFISFNRPWPHVQTFRTIQYKNLYHFMRWVVNKFDILYTQGFHRPHCFLKTARDYIQHVLTTGVKSGQLEIIDSQGSRLYGEPKKGAERAMVRVLNDAVWLRIFLWVLTKFRKVPSDYSGKRLNDIGCNSIPHPILV